jgi:hypothetical protein
MLGLGLAIGGDAREEQMQDAAAAKRLGAAVSAEKEDPPWLDERAVQVKTSELGGGSFGIVTKGKMGNIKVAVKRMKFERGKIDEKNFMSEMELLYRLEDDHIVRERGIGGGAWTRYFQHHGVKLIHRFVYIFSRFSGVDCGGHAAQVQRRGRDWRQPRL